MPDYLMIFRVEENSRSDLATVTKTKHHERTHPTMLVSWFDTTFKAYDLDQPGGSMIAANDDFKAIIVNMPKSSETVLITMMAAEPRGTKEEEALRTEYWRKKLNTLDRTTLSAAADDALFSSDRSTVSRLTEADIVSMSKFKETPKETII